MKPKNSLYYVYKNSPPYISPPSKPNPVYRWDIFQRIFFLDYFRPASATKARGTCCVIAPHLSLQTDNATWYCPTRPPYWRQALRGTSQWAGVGTWPHSIFTTAAWKQCDLWDITALGESMVMWSVEQKGFSDPPLNQESMLFLWLKLHVTYYKAYMYNWLHLYRF